MLKRVLFFLLHKAGELLETSLHGSTVYSVPDIYLPFGIPTTSLTFAARITVSSFPGA